MQEQRWHVYAVLCSSGHKLYSVGVPLNTNYKQIITGYKKKKYLSKEQGIK